MHPSLSIESYRADEEKYGRIFDGVPAKYLLCWDRWLGEGTIVHQLVKPIEFHKESGSCLLHVECQKAGSTTVSQYLLQASPSTRFSIVRIPSPYTVGTLIKVTPLNAIGRITSDERSHGGCLVRVPGYPEPGGFGYSELEPPSRLDHLLYGEDLPL